MQTGKSPMCYAMTALPRDWENPTPWGPRCGAGSGLRPAQSDKGASFIPCGLTSDMALMENE